MSDRFFAACALGQVAFATPDLDGQVAWAVVVALAQQPESALAAQAALSLPAQPAWALEQVFPSPA